MAHLPTSYPHGTIVRGPFTAAHALAGRSAGRVWDRGSAATDVSEASETCDRDSFRRDVGRGAHLRRRRKRKRPARAGCKGRTARPPSAKQSRAWPRALAWSSSRAKMSPGAGRRLGPYRIHRPMQVLGVKCGVPIDRLVAWGPNSDRLDRSVGQPARRPSAAAAPKPACMSIRHVIATLPLAPVHPRPIAVV